MSEETDAERSARHAAELEAHRKTHQSNVERAHARFPTPQGVKFLEMSAAQQRNFREKQNVIVSANRAYWRAVRQTCDRHRAESGIPAAVQQRGIRAARAAEQRRGGTLR